MFGGLGFAAALIPCLRSKDKPALTTSLMTGGILTVFTAVYFTLGLWLAFSATLVTATMWLILAAQKVGRRT